MEINYRKLRKFVNNKYPNWNIVDVINVKNSKWSLVKLWKDGKYITVKW